MLHEYGTMLLRYSYSFLKNEEDAEDIVQDVFLQYMKMKPDLDSSQHEKAWLLTVARNLCLNRLSYASRHETDELDESLAADEKEDLSFVWEAVSELPVRYREPVHLFYQEQLSTAQIAEITGKKESTVRSLLKRGREKLKDILKEAYDFYE
ncbi:MAG: RNA polymerase sigma factor [Candidatus Weimeria sp.]